MSKTDDVSFKRSNYRMLLISLLIICSGYLLMATRGDNIFSAIKITLAPVIVVAGYILVIFSIMQKGK